MKADINSILKNGANTKIKYVDYSTPEKRKELKKLKEESDLILKNKEVNWFKLSKIIINR